MNRDEVLKKIEDARVAVKEYRSAGMEKAANLTEQTKIDLIKKSSMLLLAEARFIGAAGQSCPTCNGSGRI